MTHIKWLQLMIILFQIVLNTPGLHAVPLQSEYFAFRIDSPFVMITSSSGAHDLDSIRLSTYRTACKLRFVQKKCNREYEAFLNYTTLLIPPPPPPHENVTCCSSVCSPVHLVDIWNVIEAFRENGLNTMDLTAELSVARLEMVLSTILYQLNKRMPTTHQINVEQSISLLFNFLLAAYDPWVTRHMTLGGWLCTFTWASGVCRGILMCLQWKYRLFTLKF